MESRIITLTRAAHKYGNLNLRSCGKDFFPHDCFGSNSKKNGTGKPITIHVPGITNPVKTDIPADRKSGRPRWIFRERSWVKKFVKLHSLKPKDTITIRRISPKGYCVSPNGKKNELVTLQQAAILSGKCPHNIRDYIQRGRINKYDPFGNKISYAGNGQLRISLRELTNFLSVFIKERSRHHRSHLSESLGFYDLPEYKRTKHVHRLHPYLGKFIPQLVEWFLSRFFKKNDIILDPFMGSGTTLVQANEMQMHSIGIEISEFNCLIAKVKTQKYDIGKARDEILEAEDRLSKFSSHAFPSNENEPSLFPNDKLESLKQSLLSEVKSDYLKNWFAKRTLCEMMYYRRLIKCFQHKDLLRVLLSRAVRSARLVPHYDLARPKAPIPAGKEYWCRKHKRMCKPIEQLLSKIHSYSKDTIRRLEAFDKLRSNKETVIIHGDARYIDLQNKWRNTNIAGRKINGIFTSPPYVGQIDYHDQHNYAYELFGYPRYDKDEIGPKSKGKSKNSQEEYIKGIAETLLNMKQYLKKDAKIFIVANDKLNLYPEIAKRSNLTIKKQFHRAVTKRTEQGNNPYQETIFYMQPS